MGVTKYCFSCSGRRTRIARCSINQSVVAND